MLSSLKSTVETHWKVDFYGVSFMTVGIFWSALDKFVYFGIFVFIVNLLKITTFKRLPPQ